MSFVRYATFTTELFFEVSYWRMNNVRRPTYMNDMRDWECKSSILSGSGVWLYEKKFFSNEEE